MELAWIEDFLALYRLRNFTEAAAQRCTTQPAFSRRVRNLERWLGMDLFDRASRPVALTPGGEEFLRRAERMREDILDARRIARSSQSHYENATRIYTTTAIAVGIIPRWLKETGAPRPSILTSSTGGSFEALRQKRADMIFLPWFKGDEKDPQLHYEKIASDPLILIEAPDAEERVTLEGKILCGPVMMHAPGSIFGQQLEKYLAARKITYERPIICESSSTETLLALAKQGFGAAWVPQSLAFDVRSCKACDSLTLPCDIMRVTRRDKI